MLPWTKLAQVALEFAPMIRDFAKERKSTREIRDDKSQEVFDDIYRKLDLAQSNDEELRNAIVKLELQYKKAMQVQVVIWGALLIAVVVLLFRVF